MKNNTKLILFDMDGVLVDACEWHYLSLNKSLMEVCGFEISRDDHEKRFNGLPTHVKLNILNVKEEKSKKVWLLKQKYTIDAINSEGRKDNQKINMHKSLKKLGFKIGCVTNSINKTASLMLEKTGQLNYIEKLITNEDVSSPKPNPECYIKAIDFFGFTGNEKNVYIVEDSEKGKQAALGTSANLISVKNPKDVTFKKIIKEIKKYENINTDGR